MIKNYWLFLLLIAPAVIKAQYTEVINSNRPGFSESPFSVGTGVFQVEGGYQFYGTDNFSENEKLNTHLFEQVLRLGAFSERLEFNLNFNQKFNKINNPNSPFTNNYGGGYGFGIKYLILKAKVKNRDHEIRSWKKRMGFHWTMLIPSIAIDASATYGFNPTFTEDINLSPSSLEEAFVFEGSAGAQINPSGNYKFGLLLHHQIKDSWVIVTNFRYEKRFFNNTANAEIYNFVVAATHTINDQWSLFGESKNQFNTYQNNFDFRTGLAFLVQKDLQFDSSINFNTGTELKTVGASLGFSWRIDNHVDKLKKFKPKKIDTIKKDSFIKKAVQNTKEGIIVAGLYTGLFFDNLWTDVSIFTQNVFLKKENHIPKRKKAKKKKKPKKEKRIKKPKKSRLLKQETIDFKSPSAAVKKKQLKAKEKAIRDEERRKEKIKEAQEKELREALEAEEKTRIAKEKQEEKTRKENKKIEDKELELYEKAVKEAEKEERKEAKRKRKLEEKEKKAQEEQETNS